LLDSGITDHWFRSYWTGSNLRLAVWAHARSPDCPRRLSIIDPSDVTVIEAEKPLSIERGVIAEIEEGYPD